MITIVNKILDKYLKILEKGHSMASFKGFSTVGRTSPPYTLTDVDVIKQDLMNAFQTRKGERVMMPDFGSRIWDVLYDPLDSVTEQKILEDVTNIINGDPRVQLVNTEVTEEQHSLQVIVELIIYPNSTPDKLFVEFERQGRDSF
jgi:phage baseplate assembly protein W